MKLDYERDGKDSPPPESPRWAPHTAVETDSEGSEEVESKAVDVDDSDTGSVAPVVYE